MLWTEAHTGLLISEIKNLTKDHFVYKSDDEISIRFPETTGTKGKTIKISKEFYCFMKEYWDTFDIKDSAEKIFPIGERQVQKMIKEACISLGYDADMISTHSFRKMYAANLCKEKNIRHAMSTLNHASIKVTKRYLGLHDEYSESRKKKYKQHKIYISEGEKCL